MADEEHRLAEQLARASEHLRAGRLDEAGQAIEQALALRKDDVRARNLRGLHLFRTQRYEAARAIYVTLSEEFPDDAAIRLNLGLVELRMGRNADSADNLKRVVASEPDNQRAWGYLGLALMRAGHLVEARDAFKKGGQEEMAQQVGERLAQSEEVMAARGELRRAASEGARVLEADQPFAAVELEEPIAEARRGGAWQIRNAGERAPMPGPEGSGFDGEAPGRELAQPVSGFATTHLVGTGEGQEVFSLASGGMLVIRVEDRLPTRTYGAVASTGSITFEPLSRRVRGQSVEETFGEGGEAMFAASGRGVMVVAARGARFNILALADDIVYLREANVYAFEESLHWENGRIPGAGQDGTRVVQFRGDGRLVLRTQRPVVTLKTESEGALFVDGATLIGWIGRVVPRVLVNERGEPTPYIEVSGEGVIILEEPPALTVL
jgi:Flp pilus assembly protein TadD/uncharacterized protein (AIM24 family)